LTLTIETTIEEQAMRRIGVLLPVLVALQVGVSPALAWTWPVDGPVLQPFDYGEDPYAGGQHRGIDVGGASGAPVFAPAAGTVSFAGFVPGGGQTVTIQTADGYSVTLVHLGDIAVELGAVVEEGRVVGVVGPSGTPEVAEPYVHLGIRVTADENGYLDPLAFLPPRGAGPPPPNPEPAQGTTEPVGTGSALQPPLDADAAPPQAETAPLLPPTEGAPEGDPAEPSVRPLTAEAPAEAEPGSTAGAGDTTLQSTTSTSGAEPAPPAATDSPQEPVETPGGLGAEQVAPPASEADATAAGDSAERGAGAPADARVDSEADPAPALTPPRIAEREAVTVVAAGHSARIGRRDAPKPHRRAERGQRLEPAALPLLGWNLEAEKVTTSVVALGGSAARGGAAGATRSAAPELDHRAGGVGLWPWIPASCVAGVLLGAALALRRRRATAGEAASPAGASPGPFSSPQAVRGDELSERDRLALELELEAILAVSASAGAPLEQLVTDGGASRSHS